MAFGSDLGIRLIIAAQDMTGGAVRSARDGLQSISTTAERMYNSLKQFLTFYVSISGAEQVIALGDQFENLKARIRLATSSQEEYNAAQEGLFNIAQETRSDLEAVVSLYGKTAKAIKEMGGSQQDALNLNRLIAETFKISGASAEEAKNGMLQLSQAMASGVLRGDEFNSVMENAPRLAQAMADGLNVPIGSLRKMAENGELTARRVTAALLQQKDAIERDYAQIPLTVEGAMTQANNSLLKYVGQLNESYNITQTVAGGIQFLSSHISELATAAKLLAEVWGVKVVGGFLAASQAQLQALATSRQQAAAAAEERAALLATAEARVAETRATIASTEASIAEFRARSESILAAQTQNRLLTELAAQRAALATEEQALARLQGTTAVAVTATARAFQLLNGAMSAFLAWEVGTTIGEWLNQFKFVQDAGVKIAEVFTDLQFRITNLDLRFSDPAEFDRQLANIHEQYRQIAEDTDKLQKGNQKLQDSNNQTGDSLKKLAGGLADVDLTSKKLLATQEAQDKLLQAQISTRQTLLQNEIDDLDVKRKEAEALGRIGEARQLEAQLLDVVGQKKRQEISDANALAAAKEKEYQAAANDLQLLEKETAAKKDNSEAAQTAILNAQTEAETRHLAAIAAKDHADQLTRLPPTLAQVTNAQALQNSQVKSYYNAALIATKNARDLQQAQQDGAATAQEVAKAMADAAVAVDQLAEASKRATVLEDVNAAVQRLTQSERDHAAAVRSRQAADEEATQRAKEYAAAADHAAHDSLGFASAFNQLFHSMLDPVATLSKSAGNAIVKLAGDLVHAGQSFSDFWPVFAVGNDIFKAQQAQLERNAAATDALSQAMANGVNMSQALSIAQQQLAASQAGMVDFTGRAIDGFQLLDKQQLSGLQSAIDSAKQKMQSLNDSARSTLQSLQEELFQMEGNAQAVENLQYQQKKLELQERINEARNQGNAKALADLQASLDLENRIHAKKLQSLQAQAAADTLASAKSASTNPAAPAGGQKPTDTVHVNFTLPNGSTASGDFNKNDADTLIKFLKTAKGFSV
jgi:tape measure domain-containing protein